MTADASLCPGAPIRTSATDPLRIDALRVGAGTVGLTAALGFAARMSGLA